MTRDTWNVYLEETLHTRARRRLSDAAFMVFVAMLAAASLLALWAVDLADVGGAL